MISVTDFRDLVRRVMGSREERPRVHLMGLRRVGATLHIRFEPSRPIERVRIHVQEGATAYTPTTFLSRTDQSCAVERVQDLEVTVTPATGYAGWLIPLVRDGRGGWMERIEGAAYFASVPTEHGASHAKDADPIPLGGYSLADLGTRSAADLTGTLADERLSLNVARRDQSNTFTGPSMIVAPPADNASVTVRANGTAGGLGYSADFRFDSAPGQQAGRIAYNGGSGAANRRWSFVAGNDHDGNRLTFVINTLNTAGSQITGLEIRAGASAGYVVVAPVGGRVGLYGVTPVARAAAIAAPTGGTTIDAEARAAINSIRTALTSIGITS